MATHASAEKRNRQRITRTARNRAIKANVRRALKEARDAAEKGGAEAAALVKNVHVMLDKAASKNVLPAKRAARLKARLAALLAKKK
jgi:small subunit ribosomal protein S20